MTVPTITSASMGGLPANALEIHGSGFTGVTAVEFGSTPAASFVAISDTTILAVSVTSLVAVSLVIVVTAPGGSATAAVAIEDYAPPNTVTSSSAGYLGAVSSQTAMTQLPAYTIGDFCLRVDLGELFYLVAEPATSAGNWAAADSAFVPNGDGTLSVDNANVLEPLSTVTIATTSASPTIGQATYYKATSGNLTPTLPALSGLRAGSRLAVRRDPADTSANTVTLSCAGSDTFYSSGTASTTLPMSGEQREYQVVSVSGTKYWAPAGSLNPVSALDQRYLAGASKLVSIGDNGFGSTLVGNAASTVGTGEMMFTVGVVASGIAPLWTHWYSANSTAYDTDPSGPISFNASLRVVSSSNPGTVTGTIYRLTFGGRTTATLDPGGRITADVLGISVALGDVVAVRTYLSSGTAYAPRITYGPPNVTGWGGFTTTTDLTAPGSAAISSSFGGYYGPAALLGNATPAAKSVLFLGDSEGIGAFDTAYWTRPALGFGGFAIRALSGAAGLINAAISGDQASWFAGTNGSFRRLSNAARCNSAIIQYGANDIFNNSETAAALEGYNLNIATDLRQLGIAKVFLTTLTPRTTSTDSWATTTNQTTVTGETQRVAYNTWVRAGCPVNATTLAAVAVGTSGALLAGSFGHPITGFFDIATTVESSLNSGKWLPCNRVATGSITSATITLTSSTANFNSTNQESGGDTGTSIALFGAGASGAPLYANLGIIGSVNLAYLDEVGATTVSNTQLNIGIMTLDGAHPSTHGHYLMSQAITPAAL